MGSLLQLPFALLAFVLNAAMILVNLTVGMVFTILSTLAPYATLGFFFVSNETETKGVLMAQQNFPKQVLISTPEDGEWFSQFFEANPELERVQRKGNKIVLVFPHEGKQKEETHYVELNTYSVK